MSGLPLGWARAEGQPQLQVAVTSHGTPSAVTSALPWWGNLQLLMPLEKHSWCLQQAQPLGGDPAIPRGSASLEHPRVTPEAFADGRLQSHSCWEDLCAPASQKL